MTRLTPAIGRLALVVLALTAAGCAGTPLDLVGQLVNLGALTGQTAALTPDAMAAREPHAGGNGHGANRRDGAVGEAAEGVKDPATGTELAMLPMPARPPSPRKPETNRAICGPLAAGARGMGLVESKGQQFAVECFRSKQAGPAPGVIILHGARGIGRNTIYERLAEQLTARGHHAFIFQYLGPVDAPPVLLTGKSQSPKPTPARIKTPPRKRAIDSDTQTHAIENAITAVQALSYVDHERIGMFGLSLGGFHALAIASRDARIGAVVDMFGAMPHPVGPTVGRMPPTLILHGDRDAVVPVRRAQELAKLLKSIGATHEMKIYKGQGHSFTGAADLDSIERSVEFLERWLRAQTINAG